MSKIQIFQMFSFKMSFWTKKWTFVSVWPFYSVADLMHQSCFCSFFRGSKNVEDRRICHAQSVYQGQSEPQISKLYCYYAASFPSQDSHPASSIRGCSSLHSGLLMNKHYQAFKKGQFETKILSNNIWKFLKKSQKMGILWFTFLFQFFNFFGVRKDNFIIFQFCNFSMFCPF